MVLHIYNSLFLPLPVTFGGDNAAALVGGILGTLFLLSVTIAAAAIVIVILWNYGGNILHKK